MYLAQPVYFAQPGVLYLAQPGVLYAAQTGGLYSAQPLSSVSRELTQVNK